MRYKAGDRVRVKGDLMANTKHGNYLFIDDMIRFKNREFTIKYVHSDCYELAGTPFYWTDSMLTPLIRVNIKPQELFAFLEE